MHCYTGTDLKACECMYMYMHIYFRHRNILLSSLLRYYVWIKTDVCDAVTCQNNGTCTHTNATDSMWFCDCVTGFHGTNCGTGKLIVELSLSYALAKCQNCTVMFEIFSDMYWYKIPYMCLSSDVCDAVMCQNGGTCTHTSASDSMWFCDCVTGFTGTYCATGRLSNFSAFT